MRIDRCKGCGEYIDIASDHAPGCTRNQSTEALVSRIRAVLRLISPDEITPMGVRMIEKVLDDHDPGEEVVAALLRAADALERMPPQLRHQYVATLRLYADEPWRLDEPAE